MFEVKKIEVMGFGTEEVDPGLPPHLRGKEAGEKVLLQWWGSTDKSWESAYNVRVTAPLVWAEYLYNRCDLTRIKPPAEGQTWTWSMAQARGLPANSSRFGMFMIHCKGIVLLEGSQISPTLPASAECGDLLTTLPGYAPLPAEIYDSAVGCLEGVEKGDGAKRKAEEGGPRETKKQKNTQR